MNTAHQQATEKYNSTITEIKSISDQLRIFRLQTDFEQPSFIPGQFVTIGLGTWEQRCGGCQRELPFSKERIIKRAYSVSSPVLNDKEEPVNHNELPWLELYVTLVKEGKDEQHAPFLTPRLFNLEVGDRLYMVPKIAGHYCMENIQSDDTVIFLATGTGQAPHNTMLAELLRNKHQGAIVIIECNRTFDMCGYGETLKQIAEKYSNVHYKQLATREGNDRTRIQNFIKNGRLEEEFGITISQESTKVFLCGNPAMIGVPKFNGDEAYFPIQNGAVELLMTKYGLSIHHGHTPGQIHFEKYW